MSNPLVENGTTDSVIDMESRKGKSQNVSMTATVVGWVMQNPIVFSVLCLCYGGCTIVGVSAMFELVSRDTVAVTQLVSGILGIPLLFTIYHAPFNLIKILDNTIEQLQENNEVLKQNNEVYAANNERLSTQISTLTSTNDALLSTKDELNGEVSRLKLVETGLQKGLANMSEILIQGSDKQQELQKALEHVYRDMVSSSDKLSESSSEFMKSLLKMEELTQELRKTADDNKELTEQLNSVLDELTTLLNNQKQELFNTKLRELTSRLDATSDAGLRKRLAERKVTIEDEDSLLKFLNELDELLKLHTDIEKCHRDTKHRMCQRGLIEGEDTATVLVMEDVPPPSMISSI